MDRKSEVGFRGNATSYHNQAITTTVLEWFLFFFFLFLNYMVKTV